MTKQTSQDSYTKLKFEYFIDIDLEILVMMIMVNMNIHETIPQHVNIVYA